MLAPTLRRLQSLLAHLPGVGEKTAQRYLLHLIETPGLADDLGKELLALKENVALCTRCGNIADKAAGSICSICNDSQRDSKLLCVVGRLSDLLAIERSRAMRGRFFVLGRLLSPLEGVGPEDLPIGALRKRIEEDGVKEIILATPTTVDGEATALFIKREFAPLGLAMTRIASGVPHGGDLEYADPITMGRAFSGRREL